MTMIYLQNKKCPNCDYVFVSYEYSSYSCWSGGVYTDGTTCIIPTNHQPVEYYRFFPFNVMIKCPKCDYSMMQDDAQNVGEPYDYPHDTPATSYRRTFARPTERSVRPSTPKPMCQCTVKLKDYENALNTYNLAHSKEMYIRLTLWRLWNNSRRAYPQYYPLMPYETNNLIRLEEMLSEIDPTERLTKAEIYRQLSKFDESLTLLAHSLSPEHIKFTEHLTELAHNKSPHLSLIYEY